MAVAVLIPCYNEEVTIGQVVTDFRSALPEATVYVYDNNSRDNTEEAARAAGAIVRREPLQGKGQVVRRMFADVEADVYVLVDGDNTYDASCARIMVDLLLDEQLDIDIPSGRNVKLKTEPGLDPKITEANGRRIYHWTSAHLEGSEEKKEDKEKQEKKKKKKVEDVPDVQMTTFSNWEEVGRLYASLEKDRRVADNHLRAEISAEDASQEHAHQDHDERQEHQGEEDASEFVDPEFDAEEIESLVRNIGPDDVQERQRHEDQKADQVDDFPQTMPGEFSHDRWATRRYRARGG